MDVFLHTLLLESTWSECFSRASDFVFGVVQDYPIIVTILALAVVCVMFFRTALRWRDDVSLPTADRKSVV